MLVSELVRDSTHSVGERTRSEQLQADRHKGLHPRCEALVSTLRPTSVYSAERVLW